MMSLLVAPQMLALLSQPGERRYIRRNREGSHRQIWRDYFAENCTYPADQFRRRYRMRKELFLRILKDVQAHDNYFIQKKDSAGRFGCSSIQKVTAAIRILAYGCSKDQCDEYLDIGKSTAIESLNRFCDAVIRLYEGQYLREPNEHDIARLLAEGEERGFPGMLGYLDCMHWEWKNCPVKWHNPYKSPHLKPNLILEAVASKDLSIWYSFVGMLSHDDVNVLDHSPLFDTFVRGRMPPANYVVNGRQYTMGYCLSDGMYPHWATLIQTISQPITEKERLFAKKLEDARMDVERAFGVLHTRWGITQGPVRNWKKEDFCRIMKTCIILHNMIIEDERDSNIESWIPPQDETISSPEYARDPALLVACMSSRLSRVHSEGTNMTLRFDLMEHLWSRFGDPFLCDVV